MKRSIVLAILLALSGPFLFAQAIDKVVATVRLTKPQAITVRQLRKLVDPLETRAKRSLTKDERMQVLDGLINRALIEQVAERDKVYVSDPELKAWIEQRKKLMGVQLGMGRDLTDAEMQNLVKNQGISWDDYLQEIKYSLLTQSYAKFKNKNILDVPQPTDDEAVAYYDANKTKEFVLDDMVHMRWILVDTRALTSKDERDKASKRADDILKELRGGTKFEDLVSKYSDDTSSKYKGGDVGWLMRNNDQSKQMLGADFISSVFALKKGDVSGVLNSNVGFAVVQVVDRIDARILGFDDKVPPLNQITVKDAIKGNLLAQRQNDAFTKTLQDIVNDLRKKAEIKVFDENLAW
jgi:parvulin-like peptidyl-prolyl isomerase